jgi:hypothetical protein
LEISPEEMFQNHGIDNAEMGLADASTLRLGQSFDDKPHKNRFAKSQLTTMAYDNLGL